MLRFLVNAELMTILSNILFARLPRSKPDSDPACDKVLLPLNVSQTVGARGCCAAMAGNSLDPVRHIPRPQVDLVMRMHTGSRSTALDVRQRTSGTASPCGQRCTFGHRSVTSTSCRSTCERDTPARRRSDSFAAHSAASRDAEQWSSTHEDKLPQTEQNRRGAAVVGGPTAAVRYDGTPAGRAARFACAYADSLRSQLAFGRQPHVDTHQPEPTQAAQLCPASAPALIGAAQTLNPERPTNAHLIRLSHICSGAKH